MALSGLEIYKQLPKTNCKECGFPTCLAFAMQLAAKKASLDKCPHVTEAAKGALESASLPPIKLVTIGAGDKKLEVGNETVMFRHEEAFYHPAGIGFLVEDTLSDVELRDRIAKIEKLKFERVGQQITVDLIAIKQSGNPQAFANAVREVAGKTHLNLVLVSQDPEAIKGALEAIKDRRPLIYAATQQNYEGMAKLAKEYSVPLTVLADSLERLAELSKKVSDLGATDLVLDCGPKKLPEKIRELTHIRRLALKKTFRPFGYPTIVMVSAEDPYEEVAQVSSYVAKYGSIAIMQGIRPWQVLPILTVRQNIFTDPQRPLQVEPKLYEIGSVGDKSPVIVTTNFSLTYFTVEAEVEASKVPTYIISTDSEGMSVLTAWAAEKFTVEKIAEALNKCGIKDKVAHKNVIIPGYVSVMSGKLEEESGWKVLVGPREASGLPAFLKGL